MRAKYLFIGFSIFISMNSFAKSWIFKNAIQDTLIVFDDTRDAVWSNSFSRVEIKSSNDQEKQPAFFYKTTSRNAQPLIVSLHTWSGNYSQRDSISAFAKKANYNYIHPNFRGANNLPEACGSTLTISDIDDSIDFAIKFGNVDPARIYVIGVSGGGHATLNTFMHSKHNIARFSSWAAISDLVAWYYHCTEKELRYAHDIYTSTNSANNELNLQEAKKRSPIYANTPVDKLKDTEVSIFAGINDGVQGSVPFTQSIKFYNKLLKDLNVLDKSAYVSQYEIDKLLKYREPLDSFGNIQGREICLIKKYGNIQLIIFNGGHEMLSNYAFERLTK